MADQRYGADGLTDEQRQYAKENRDWRDRVLWLFGQGDYHKNRQRQEFLDYNQAVAQLQADQARGAASRALETTRQIDADQDFLATAASQYAATGQAFSREAVDAAKRLGVTLDDTMVGGAVTNRTVFTPDQEAMLGNLPSMGKYVNDIRSKGSGPAARYARSLRVAGISPDTVDRYTPPLREGQVLNDDFSVATVPNFDESASNTAGMIASAEAKARADQDPIQVMDKRTGEIVIVPKTEAVRNRNYVDASTGRELRAEDDASKLKAAASAQSNAMMNSFITNALNNITPYTTGFGAALQWVPGTDAKRLAGELQAIIANIGFDRLQLMRDQSTTGGTLGNVSNIELSMLQSVSGTFDQANDPNQLAYNLTRYGKVLNAIVHEGLEAAQRAYMEPYDPKRSYVEEGRMERELMVTPDTTNVTVRRVE